MRKKLIIALLSVLAVIPSSIYAAATELMNSAPSQVNTTHDNNQVVFSIPVGTMVFIMKARIMPICLFGVLLLSQ